MSQELISHNQQPYPDVTSDNFSNVPLEDQSAEQNPGDPVEFAPADPYYWEPYPADHPARRYLEKLLATPLTHAERTALEGYIGNESSSEINRSLMEGRPKYEVRKIDEAMDKVRLPRTTIVYRGDSSNMVALDDVKTGTTFERIGYTSSTLDSTLARSWHDSRTVLKIEVPQGTPVAVPSLEEAEILLPHGSTFEIIDAREVEEGEYVEVYVRLVSVGNPVQPAA